MNKPQLELADVVRRFAGPYKELFGHLMLPSHHRALQDIAGCMTEAMGGGRYHCHDCSETFWSYHGCRNRSCPKCHGRQIADWLKCRSAEKRYVGAEVGILAVLHTWTGRLHHHPHVHMLVTGGSVTDDGTAWHDAPNDFLVPVRKLSPMIARRFAEALQKGHPNLFKQIPAKV